jgi:cation:H+ antiporter
MLFGLLLIVMLLLVVLASFLPPVTVAAVHPVSALVVATYLAGLVLIRRNSEQPMWRAVQTAATQPDEPAEQPQHRSGRSLWAEFAAVGVVVALGGWAIAVAAESIAGSTGLAAGFVGAVLMGGVNALPETVTAIAAVRRGALTLAIAGVLGGNCLDALNIVVGDVAFRGGSLYHAASSDALVLTLASAVMAAVVVAGMIVRQSRGWGRVGFEGVLLAGIYIAVVAVLAL